VTAGYAEDLVAEAKRDRGHGRLPSPTITAGSANPSCGDEVELDIAHDGTTVADVAQRTRGCTFTHASASLLARFVPGMSVRDARDLAARLRQDIVGGAALPSVFSSLESVRVYPARTRCALLPWEALSRALAEV
jgi:SUF system NifU family Fe-S assembly protein